MKEAPHFRPESYRGSKTKKDPGVTGVFLFLLGVIVVAVALWLLALIVGWYLAGWLFG